MNNKAILTTAGIFAIILWGFSIYGNTFLSPFLFDDGYFIVNNAQIQNLSNLRPLFQDESNRRRFFTFLTFALNYHFGKENVFGYHFINISIHILNSLLVWLFVFQLLSLPCLKDNPLSQHKGAASFLAALIFLTHPIQTQAITYISQRFTSLASFFYLSTVNIYIKIRLELIGSITRRRRILKYSAAFMVCTILGVFSKEIMLTLPFVLILIEWFFFKDSGGFNSLIKILPEGMRSKMSVLLEERGAQIRVYFTLLFLGFISIFFIMISPSFQTLWKDVFFRGFSPLKYLFTQNRVIVTYIRLLFLPINQNADYDYPWARNYCEFSILLSLLLIIGLIFLAFKLKDKQPLISFGVLWFFITLSAESTFFPLPDLIMEHRVYLPAVGFCLILVMMVYGLLYNFKKFIFVMTCLIMIFSFLTFTRNESWKDEMTFWEDVVKKSTGKARVHMNLANAYIKHGSPQLALEHYNKAIELEPSLYKAHYNKCALLTNLGKFREALPSCDRALIIKPFFPEAYYTRAVIYKELNQIDKALDDYRWAFIHDPKLVDAYLSRGSLYLKQRRYDQAIENLNQVLELRPNDAQAYQMRCVAYRLIREYDLAFQDCNRAISINSNLAIAYFNRSLIYQSKYNFQEAFIDAIRARSLGYQVPQNYIDFLNNLVKDKVRNGD
jgi:protein O-mannosyl-transferase